MTFKQLVLPKGWEDRPAPKVLDTAEKVRAAAKESRRATEVTFKEFAAARRRSWQRAKETMLD